MAPAADKLSVAAKVLSGVLVGSMAVFAVAAMQTDPLSHNSVPMASYPAPTIEQPPSTRWWRREKLWILLPKVWLQPPLSAPRLFYPKRHRLVPRRSRERLRRRFRTIRFAPWWREPFFIKNATGEVVPGGEKYAVGLSVVLYDNAENILVSTELDDSGTFLFERVLVDPNATLALQLTVPYSRKASFTTAAKRHSLGTTRMA